ncbi:hypothetical protein K7432_015765 [Basidiobolus ranarum]|uniref:Extracellular membrane protein CFEM domain-containing protein n=1 Tax=Basidiobolus ranarum TaxID=34480 RepID=A0ABR2VMM4_9FUNG
MAKRPIITSCSSGSTTEDSGDSGDSAPAGSSTSSAATPSKTATTKPNAGGSYKKPQSNTETDSPIATPEPTPSAPEVGDASACEQKCLGGPNLQVCGNGGATAFKKICALGTNCHMQDGVVACI